MQLQKGIVLFLVIVALLGGIIFTNHVLLGDAFSKEEAQHALYAVWLTKDIHTLDWGAFWYDTQRQMFWPFLHSWVLTLFFLIFGVNYIAAHLLSFVIFIGTLVLMYDVCDRFSRKSGWKIGMLSVFLAFSSPMMLRYATENTLEGLGALLFLAAFYIYEVSEEKRLTAEYVLIAGLMGLSIYTNYLYAYLMIPAFVVMTMGKLGPISYEVAQLSSKGEKAAVPFLWWAYRKLIVLAVLAILVGGWLFTPGFSRKIMLLMQAIFRYSGTEASTGFWQGLLFYPRVIIDHFSFSPWIGSLMLISLFLPFIAFRFRQVGKLYTFIWTAIILATLTVPTKAPQFIYIILPFVFMVFSTAVFYFLEDLKKFAAVGLAVLLLPALISFPRFFDLYFAPLPSQNMVQVLNYFHKEVPPREAVASAVNIQYLNPEGIAFHFSDWKAPVLADPALSQDDIFIDGRYFLTVDLDSASPYRSEILDDSIYNWNGFLTEKLRRGEVREYSMRRFENMGLTARIYEKTAR